MKIAFAAAAAKTLARRIPEMDARRIRDKIGRLAADPTSPLHDVKPLVNRLGFRRLRVGDWRVIFRIDGDTLVVELVGHRKDIYR